MGKFLKAKDAADYTGLSAGQVQRYFDLGAFEGFVTPGGHRYISIESLDRFNADPKGTMRRFRYKRMQEQGKMIGTCRIIHRTEEERMSRKARRELAV